MRSDDIDGAGSPAAVAVPPLEITQDADWVLKELGVRGSVQPVYDVLCEEIRDFTSASLVAIPDEGLAPPHEVAFEVASSLSVHEFGKRSDRFFLRLRDQFEPKVWRVLFSILQR